MSRGRYPKSKGHQTANQRQHQIEEAAGYACSLFIIEFCTTIFPTAQSQNGKYYFHFQSEH
jgi:hypothetical protein